MKAIIVFLVMVLLFLPLLNGENKTDKIKLPPIETLKELPLELVADFTENEDIASPALPIMNAKGDLFFYDWKLSQVTKTHLENQEVKAIGRQGEGPGEYIWVLGICTDDQNVYITDSKRKLLCFDLKGKYKWETRTSNDNRGVIGVNGEIYYMEGIVDLSKLDKSTQGFFEFQKDKPQRLIVDEPLFILLGSASSPTGKKGAVGIFFLGFPAMLLDLKGDQIITAAEPDYQINFYDLQGKTKKSIQCETLKPQFSEGLKKIAKNKKNIYAVMDIFLIKDRLAVISNYFIQGKPRLDLFDMKGKLIASYLMPFQVDKRGHRLSGGAKTVRFTQGYVIYKDPDYSGFKIYRPKITL